MHHKILLLGGTGFVGTSLCKQLVGAGHELVVPSRHPEQARVEGVQLVRADVHDPKELLSLLQGCDAVVNLVAILHGSEAAFERAHVALPQTLVQACGTANVRRVVHVSALGVGPNAPSAYLRSKTAGEAVLAQAGLELTLLRPSVIFGARDRFLNLFATLQKWFPVLPLAGASARFQPVWVEDVAAAIARCVDDDKTIGQVYELTGPQVYTLKALVQSAGRWAGHRRPVIGLPSPLARLQALAMECLPGETLMSRDNLDSMKVDNVASGRLPGLPALGITPTPLDKVGPGYLG